MSLLRSGVEPKRDLLRGKLALWAQLMINPSQTSGSVSPAIGMWPSRLLSQGFLDSEVLFPDRPAIDVGREVSYLELARRAKAIAATIQQHACGGPLTAVFACRSEAAYVGVLGALLAGHGYVPLNRAFPAARTRLMLQKAGCETLIVDENSEPQLSAVLAGIERSLLLLFPDRVDVSHLAAKFPNHCLVAAGDFASANDWLPPVAQPDSVAYLLFTSGSTGEPKGVMVSHANACHYIDSVQRRYGFTSEDRMSQTFDLTFDLSVHDMFAAWQSGGCVCCPTLKQTIKPSAFINDARLTAWFSVPSNAIFMRRLGGLEPNAYPNLRLSLFCGEALPVEIAKQWALAAPNSVIENLYGPTELTIACTGYRWTGSEALLNGNGLVPIGKPFAGMHATIVNEKLEETPNGESGELLVAGPQLSLGYWQDEARTRRSFVALPGSDRIYYRTGDRVRRAPDGSFLFLGRLDGQLKVLGHRVELGEIEAALRLASGVVGAVAVGWPIMEGVAEGIEAFLEADKCDTAAVIKELRAKLPTYMVPRNIHLLPTFPRNANGKYDRNALMSLLSE